MSPSLDNTVQGDATETAAVADGPEATAADLAACKAILQEGSKSFHLASRLLPGRVREPAAALYAFCRLADDAVDLEGGEGDAVTSLACRLDRIYGGNAADDPVERALSATVRRHGLPRAILDALIEGLTWDTEGRRYETISDLRSYAARVASTVGVATTLLMGVRSSAALARAADLGVAMQLTNIARDVGEDAGTGRLYLPRSWMREAGLDPDAWLAAPRFDQRLAGVVARLLAEADRLYQRSTGGIALLPRDCRPGIHAARLIYREIGRQLARAGHDSISQRTIVPFRRKLALVAKAGLASTASLQDGAGAPPLQEIRFLIDAVNKVPVSAEAVGSMAKPSIGERIGWAIELFARLEEHDQLQRAAGRRPI